MKELIKVLKKYNVADEINQSNNKELIIHSKLTKLPESFDYIKGGDILFLNSDNKLTSLPESLMDIN